MRSRQRRPRPVLPEWPIYTLCEARKRLTRVRAVTYWPTGRSAEALRARWRLTTAEMAHALDVPILEYQRFRREPFDPLPAAIADRCRALTIAACQHAISLGTSRRRGRALRSSVHGASGGSAPMATPSTTSVEEGARISGGRCP